MARHHSVPPLTRSSSSHRGRLTMLLLFLLLLLSTDGHAEISTELNCEANLYFFVINCTDDRVANNMGTNITGRVLMSMDEQDVYCEDRTDTLQMVVEIDAVSGHRFDFRVFFRQPSELNFTDNGGVSLLDIIPSQATMRLGGDRVLTLSDHTTHGSGDGVTADSTSYRFTMEANQSLIHSFSELKWWLIRTSEGGSASVLSVIDARHLRRRFREKFSDMPCNPSDHKDFCSGAAAGESCDKVESIHNTSNCNRRLWFTDGFDDAWEEVKGVGCKEGMWEIGWSESKSGNAKSSSFASTNMYCYNGWKCDPASLVDYCATTAAAMDECFKVLQSGGQFVVAGDYQGLHLQQRFLGNVVSCKLSAPGRALLHRRYIPSKPTDTEFWRRSSSGRLFCYDSVHACDPFGFVDHCTTDEASGEPCQKVEIFHNRTTTCNSTLWYSKGVGEKWRKINASTIVEDEAKPIQFRCHSGKWEFSFENSLKSLKRDNLYKTTTGRIFCYNSDNVCNRSQLVDYCKKAGGRENCDQLAISHNGTSNCSSRLWYSDPSDGKWMWVQEFKCEDGEWKFSRWGDEWVPISASAQIGVSKCSLLCSEERPFCEVDQAEAEQYTLPMILLGVYCGILTIVLIVLVKKYSINRIKYYVLFGILFCKMDNCKGQSKFKIIRIKGTREPSPRMGTRAKKSSSSSGSSSDSNSGKNQKKDDKVLQRIESSKRAKGAKNNQPEMKEDNYQTIPRIKDSAPTDVDQLKSGR